MSKEVKAGLIALLAVISFIFLFQFMKGKNLFSTDNVYYARYDDVQGLEQSSPVTLNGLKIGQIEKIEPKTAPNGKIYFIVHISADSDFEFSKASTVKIYEPGLMSGKALKINAVYGKPIAQDGDFLNSDIELSMLQGLTSQVGPVKDQLQAALKTIDSLANNANRVLDSRNRAELRSLLINLNRTASSLALTSQGAGQLVTNSDPRLQRVLDNANAAVLGANIAIGKYGTLAESVDTRQLNATVANLDQTVTELKSVIAAMQRGEGTLGKVLKDEQLYNKLNETATNLNDLVVDLKQNPKRYLNFSVFGKNNSAPEKK